MQSYQSAFTEPNNDVIDLHLQQDRHLTMERKQFHL